MCRSWLVLSVWFVCVVWLVVDWDFVGDCVCDFLDADDVYVCVI